MDGILANIPHDLSPLLVDDRVVATDSMIALKCTRGHIHKYFLSDLKNVKCETCTSGSKFARMTREVAESVFGAPFMLAGDHYFSHTLQIGVRPVQYTGHDSVAIVDKCTMYIIHHTSSSRKVERSLRRLGHKQKKLAEIDVHHTILRRVYESNGLEYMKPTAPNNAHESILGSESIVHQYADILLQDDSKYDFGTL